MTLQIAAAKLLPYSTQQLWDNLAGEFSVVFDDGVVQTNEREVIYSSYAWALHRRYPKTPLKAKHHVQSVFTPSREMPAQAHLKLLNNVFWDVYDAYRDDYPDRRVLIEELSLLVYQISNQIYNDLSIRLEAYVTSLDITDFLAILRDPVIAQGIADAQPTEQGIEKVNKLIQDRLDHAPEFYHNPLATTIRTGIARMGQALQCLGLRGFITDVDSQIFPEPIMTSYISGHRSLYASMIESRSAAKSLMNTTKPLQDSEYFSRRQQLVCMNIRNLHMIDCGSQAYLYWTVRPERYEGATKVSEGDLATIQGSYYLDETTGTLKVVRKSDKHLIGKTIPLRSVVAGCNHPDPNGVCEVCFGETALALPINSNAGHNACVTMTAVLGQLILSTKHFDGSSKVEGIYLEKDPVARKYLSAPPDGNSYFLNEALRGRNIKIRVSVDDAKGLPDLRLVDDVAKLNVLRTSQFEGVTFVVEDPVKKETHTTTVRVVVNQRKASLTTQMLAHIKSRGADGYQIIKDARDGKYEFDLTGWDFSQPIFVLPMRHFNMSNHQFEIARMLEATAEEMEKRSKDVSPTAMLVEFHDLVNRRLSVNLSVLSLIIYSSMVVNIDECNYDLPKLGTQMGLGVLKALLAYRSLSAMLSYEGHRQTFTDASSFRVRNRLDHPFDSLFMPHEVLTEHGRR